MKLSAALLLAPIGASSAFSSGRASRFARTCSLRAGDDDDLRTVTAPRGQSIEQKRYGVGESPFMAGPDSSPKRKAPRKSQAIPFVDAPRFLDGTLAGDFGFDPMGFADSYENLNNYREAEVKHGRLAMLAAAGWPLSELWDRGLANTFGMDPLLDEHGRVPSVLNGGMGKVSLGYWAGCIALAGALDVYGSYFASKRDGYVAGDLGFDPLNFYPSGSRDKEVKRREELRLSEIKHGRLAMIAITAFAFQEFASGTAVVDHASVFFKPIWSVLWEASQGPSVDYEPEALAPYVAPAVQEAASTFAPAVPEAASTVAPAVPEVAATVAPVVPEAASTIAPVVPEAASTMAPAVEAFTPPAVPEVAAITEKVEAVVTSAPAPPAGLGEELAAKQARIAELESMISAREAEAASSVQREIAEANAKLADLQSRLAQIEAMAR